MATRVTIQPTQRYAKNDAKQKIKTFFQVVDLMRWFMFSCYIWFLSSFQDSDSVIQSRLYRIWRYVLPDLAVVMFPQKKKKKYENESTKYRKLCNNTTWIICACNLIWKCLRLHQPYNEQMEQYEAKFVLYQRTLFPFKLNKKTENICILYMWCVMCDMQRFSTNFH